MSLGVGNVIQKEKLRQAILDLVHADNTISNFQLPVTGGSMMPMLMEGDMLSVIPVAAGQIKRGDIIVRWDTNLVTHRVINVLQDQIYTKGDARHWIDLPARASDILGKVTHIERSGNKINMNERRWTAINRSIGWLAWLEARSLWSDQKAGKSSEGNILLHSISFWLSKKMNGIIIFIFAGSWLRQRHSG